MLCQRYNYGLHFVLIRQGLNVMLERYDLLIKPDDDLCSPVTQLILKSSGKYLSPKTENNNTLNDKN